ncbi:hypothetical protein L1887_48577 [Cichorium endivia]|nr:hypothetical protein L1887_48577 [Cichorium endivia]
MSSPSQHTSTNNAFVTLLTSDHYLPGALVLAESLRISHGLARKGKARAGPSRSAATTDFQVVALITPDTLSVQSIKALRRSGLFDWIVGVEPIGFRQILASSTHAPTTVTTGISGSSTARDAAVLDSDLDAKIRDMERNFGLLGRPDLTNTLTKLHAWRLGRDSAHLVAQAASPVDGSDQKWLGFDKLVFLDADTLVLRPIDHLFRLGSSVHFAAAPDTGWPDAFNSGVMMLTPSTDTFEAIRSFARTTGSWDGADQGLLNDFYGSDDSSASLPDEAQSPDTSSAPGGGWKRLSFRYNVTSHGGYTFAPAYQRYGQNINIVHFIGQHKPWNRPRPHGSAQPNPLVAPRDLDSQPITPDQPDYLLALWHSAFASLYPSSGSASPDSEIEIVHTERGVEVVERRNFTVPTYHAVWDAEAREEDASSSGLGFGIPVAARESAPAQPRAHQHWEASYASLPLDGRSSLIPPVPEVARTPSPPTPTQESIDAELRSRDASPAQPIPVPVSSIQHGSAANKGDEDDSDTSPQHYSPPKLSWNPAHGPPPTGSGAALYQMRVPIDAYYANIWDAGQKTPRTLAEQKAAFFVPQPQGAQDRSGRQRGGPGYIPSQLRRDHVFDNLGSHKPDASKVKPIFPWETQQRTPTAPTRVFPDEPRRSLPPSADTTPKMGSTQQGNNGAFAASVVSAPAVSRPRGLPANLSFVNAWDQAGAIGNFANAWNRRANPASPNRRRAAETGNRQAARDNGAARQTEPRQRAEVQRVGSPQASFRPAYGAERRASMEEVTDARDGEASDSRDGDDESSSGEESSGNEGVSQVVEGARDGTPSPTNSRQAGWPREGPGRGYMRKAENSVYAQMHATPRSPRMTSRVLSYTSTATEGEGRSGRVSGSSTASEAAARQRAKDRIRPDGWISTGSGSGMSSPPYGGWHQAEMTAASLRGIPGMRAGQAHVRRRHEPTSSNDSLSEESRSASPTALIAQPLPAVRGQVVPPSPPSLEEPFSSSPRNTRAELSQHARTHLHARRAHNFPHAPHAQ